MTNDPNNALKVGAEVRGKVKNIQLFGAFVDIGAGQDALLHVSQLGKNVRNVEDAVKVGDEITVYVLRLDESTGRIALSMTKPPERSWDDVREGEPIKGTVVRFEKYGVFVDVGLDRPAMIHVSELADGYVKQPSDVVKIGQEVEGRVLKVNRRQRKVDMSLKPLREKVERAPVEEAEEEGENLTPMALAFRKAMGNDAASNAEKARKNEKGKRTAEQDEIIARTLRQHQGGN
jgi:small subunit ribosomal protein S1